MQVQVVQMFLKILFLLTRFWQKIYKTGLKIFARQVQILQAYLCNTESNEAHKNMDSEDYFSICQHNEFVPEVSLVSTAPIVSMALPIAVPMAPVVLPMVMGATAQKRELPWPEIPRSRYRLFIPPKVRTQEQTIRDQGQALPVIVMLHGCLQSAAKFEEASQLNQLAASVGFFVLYPDQLRGRNMMNCWNWYDSANQAPFSGEIGEVLKMLDQVESEYNIDPTKVFVAGLSAGAGIAAGLLACHPTRFAGGLLHSGPGYACANGIFHGAHVLRSGPHLNRVSSAPGKPKDFLGKLIVVRGKRDQVVHPSHVSLLIEQFVSAEEIQSAKTQVWAGASPGDYSSDLTSYGKFTHEGLEGSRVDSESQLPRVYRVEVNEMGHAWSGGKAGHFGDPKGPNINAFMVDFFLR
jgi:poly(hydroxyalkanoate) depolymerase family esterase